MMKVRVWICIPFKKMFQKALFLSKNVLLKHVFVNVKGMHAFNPTILIQEAGSLENI